MNVYLLWASGTLTSFEAFFFLFCWRTVTLHPLTILNDFLWHGGEVVRALLDLRGSDSVVIFLIIWCPRTIWAWQKVYEKWICTIYTGRPHHHPLVKILPLNGHQFADMCKKYRHQRHLSWEALQKVVENWCVEKCILLFIKKTWYGVNKIIFLHMTFTVLIVRL